MSEGPSPVEMVNSACSFATEHNPAVGVDDNLTAIDIYVCMHVHVQACM